MYHYKQSSLYRTLYVLVPWRIWSELTVLLEVWWDRDLKTVYNKAKINAYIQLAFSNFQIKKIKGDVRTFPKEKSMKCND